MDSLLLVIGILLGFLFALAVTLLITSSMKKTVSHKSILSIELLKKQAGDIRGELLSLEEKLWVYGVGKEEENKKWQRVYRDFASKTINTLQSCWIGKDDDPTSKATYDELLTGLKTIGIEEIIPKIGELVNENDKNISIRVISGKPPYVVKTLVYPGYQLNSRQLGTTMVLSPAIVEVVEKE